MTTVRDFIKNNPRQAFEEIYSSDLPNDVEVEILQDTDKIKYLVLPSPSLGSDEMSEVSGGAPLDSIVRAFRNEATRTSTASSSSLSNLSFIDKHAVAYTAAEKSAQTRTAALGYLGVGAVSATAGAGGVIAYDNRDAIYEWLNKGI